MTKSKPNGARIQRQRRKMAELRASMATRLIDGRRQAVDALVARARQRALWFGMPSVHTARGMRDRVRTWFIHRAADLVAWKIRRDTYSTKFQNMIYEMGVDNWLRAIKGSASTQS